MKNENKLYMVMLGCRPAGRYTEQHDIFFWNWNIIKRINSKYEGILARSKR